MSFRSIPLQPSLSLSALVMAVVLAWFPPLAHGEAATTLSQVNEFIAEVAARHGFVVPALYALFDNVTLRPEIIETITRPAEAKPWFEYRAIFLTQARIEGGIEFWREHQDALSVAESRYGVDPAIVVAILGVETRYGAKTGTYRVIDALTTLAFQYPKRASFFRDQLEEYLLLTRNEGIDPLLPKGSYAGAMGLPQFMPTSFRDFAVDLDGDGHRDLWNNPWDAIGSVANYLRRHDWQPQGPVAVPANLVAGVDPAPLLKADLKPNLYLNRLRAMGLQPTEPVSGNPPVALLRLDGKISPEYWLGFQNFYAITRYNHSPLYAMAVHQLAREIVAGMAKK
ncbi:Membrane-bound lytic murein transglycosylase B [Gammaproteobacteria bacterium]